MAEEKMVRQHCSACGKIVWHNPMGKKKDAGGGVRCTYCAHPVGTGPKAERHRAVHDRQVAKANATRTQ